VPVHVEVGNVAVHPLAHRICHPAHGQNVVRAIERHAVVEAQPLARLHLGRNRAQPRIAGLEPMPRLHWRLRPRLYWQRRLRLRSGFRVGRE